MIMLQLLMNILHDYKILFIERKTNIKPGNIPLFKQNKIWYLLKHITPLIFSIRNFIFCLTHLSHTKNIHHILYHIAAALIRSLISINSFNTRKNYPRFIFQNERNSHVYAKFFSVTFCRTPLRFQLTNNISPIQKCS